MRAKITSFTVAIIIALTLAIPQRAVAHCDTLDGPVIQDARKAIAAKDVTPVLKWVKPRDEKAVRSAFRKVLAAKGHSVEAAENEFFRTLIKLHREGEGATFKGLQPAGAVEPAVAEADKALKSGSADSLVNLVTSEVASGIKERFDRAASAYRHKDESVAQGREFVEAYVEFTHYVERLHMDASGKAAHGEHGGGGKESQHKDRRSGHGAGKH